MHLQRHSQVHLQMCLQMHRQSCLMCLHLWLRSQPGLQTGVHICTCIASLVWRRVCSSVPEQELNPNQKHPLPVTSDPPVIPDPIDL